MDKICKKVEEICKKFVWNLVEKNHGRKLKYQEKQGRKLRPYWVLMAFQGYLALTVKDARTFGGTSADGPHDLSYFF